MYFRRKGKRYRVASEVISLDIETSWNKDIKNPKCWIVSIQVYFLGNYYFFRKPTELIEWYQSLIERYNLSPEKKIVNIIHNASFDLSYLIAWFQAYLPHDEMEGIYLDKNKILTYQQYCFEWRCTYLLTQKSLATWSEDMAIEHPKKVGLYNYSATHYQDDELDVNELVYDKYDVLALSECFVKQLEAHEDNIATIPLTSTGYSRRLFRDATKKDKYYREQYFRANRLDVMSYKYCVNSFSGGFTHNNRFKKNKLIQGLIGHRDFRSMYPSEMRCRPLPFGKPEVVYDIRKKFYRDRVHLTIDDILAMYPEYTAITHIKLYAGTKLKDENITMPFMQRSKCVNNSDGFRCSKDNGRILSILDGSTEMYLSNRTLQILNEQYHLEYAIMGVIRFKNEYMPKCLADVIDELFKKKTDYKIIAQELEEKYGKLDERTQEAYFRLALTKALLNATFGMFATKPVREKWEIDYSRLNNEELEDWEREAFHRIEQVRNDEDISAELDKYYAGRNNFLAYQVGIAITEESKYELYTYIKAIGYDKVLYCDTDSIFYLKDEDTEKAIEELNAYYHKTAQYITDSQGNRVYYDVFEDEPDLIAFKGMHSKCYGVVTEKKKELQLVIAGIPAKTLVAMDGDKPIYLTRENELAGLKPNEKITNPIEVLDRLSDRFEFKVNTGTTCRYIYDLPHTEIIDGHEIELAGGAIIQTLESKMIKDVFDDEK